MEHYLRCSRSSSSLSESFRLFLPTDCSSGSILGVNARADGPHEALGPMTGDEPRGWVDANFSLGSDLWTSAVGCAPPPFRPPSCQGVNQLPGNPLGGEELTAHPRVGAAERLKMTWDRIRSFQNKYVIHLMPI